MRKNIFHFFRNLMAVIGTFVVILGVYFFSTNASSVETLLRSIVLIESQSLYRENVDSGAMVLGATEGIVGSLNDPYSYYLTPKQWQEQQEKLNAEFAGIGVYMGVLEDGSIVLMAPIPNTPAEQAGLQSGDILLAVDGTSVSEMTLDEVNTLVRGEAGTQVSLSIHREGEDSIRDFTITRAIIEVPSVYSEMVDEEAGIGYIYLSTFHSKSPEEIQTATEELQAMGAKSLVLDLRDNGGGDYNAALKIADYFLDDKDIVQIAGAHGVLYIEHSNSGANPIPLVLLVNGNTASASEVLASALRDNQRAQLIGQTTYGKGIIQVLFPLNDGGALKLTTNQYLNLQGEAIHEVGLVPDETVEESEDLLQDLPLERAIEILKETSAGDISVGE